MVSISLVLKIESFPFPHAYFQCFLFFAELDIFPNQITTKMVMYRVEDRVLFSLSLSSCFLLSVFLLSAYVKWGHGPVTPTTTTPRTEESRTMKFLEKFFENMRNGKSRGPFVFCALEPLNLYDLSNSHIGKCIILRR